MELDHLKEMWTKDEVSETPEISLDEQKEINNPIEKIKRNIRFEIWSMIPFIPLAIYVLIKYVQDDKMLIYVMSLLLVMVLVTVFFYLKITKFYKAISKNTFQTYEHLLELEYQIKYFRDLYQSYYIAFVPIMLSELILIFQYYNPFDLLSLKGMIAVFGISLLFGFGFLFVAWKLWYHFFYGKYINQITKIIKEIKS